MISYSIVGMIFGQERPTATARTRRDYMNERPEVATLLQNCCRGKERNMKHIITILTQCFDCVAHIAISAQERQWLPYEPATVELEDESSFDRNMDRRITARIQKRIRRESTYFWCLRNRLTCAPLKEMVSTRSQLKAREIQLILTDGKPSHKH